MHVPDLHGHLVFAAALCLHLVYVASFLTFHAVEAGLSQITNGLFTIDTLNFPRDIVYQVRSFLFFNLLIVFICEPFVSPRLAKIVHTAHFA